MQTKPASPAIQAIGLMSGTSLDGVDAALIVTDGVHIANRGDSLTIPYSFDFQQKLRELMAGKGDIGAVAKELTHIHAEAVQALLKKQSLTASEIGVIGFHGQTIVHKPHEGITLQIGDGALLAKLTGIDVVNDFRSRDVAEGGQGAPLVPVYHQALMADEEKPIAVLNIGGVANVTWIGENSEDLLAFDTGAGNALMNDWVHLHTGKSHDENGGIAAKGVVSDSCLASLLEHPYFAQKPPKSLDRNSFDTSCMKHLSFEDGAATLSAFTAASIAKAADHFPSPVKKWFVCGGGRHNPTLMQMLTDKLGSKILPIESLGFDGDATEAEAFAFLAVRSLKQLPISFPTTTGVKIPVCGGQFHISS